MSVLVCACGIAAAHGADDIAQPLKYPYKANIVTTCFWVGEGTCGVNSTDNVKSAWDPRWVQSFGGVDQPDQRTGSNAKPGTVSLPAKFVPRQNPYYVALPFNDVKFPEIARKVIPWWREADYRGNPNKSQCQGRWIKIFYQNRVCFAQWEDVGPYRVDHHEYVFGNDRPDTGTQAGLDVSPAVRDYLGLNGKDKTTWRFVDRNEVPLGPWIDAKYTGPVFAQAPRPRMLNTIRLPISSTGPFAIYP